MPPHPWSVYIIRCKNNSLYTGITTDVFKRFQEHSSQGPKCAKYLRGKGPLQLAYADEIGSRSKALKMEAKIKRMPKSKKEKLIHFKRIQRFGDPGKDALRFMTPSRTIPYVFKFFSGGFGGANDEIELVNGKFIHRFNPEVYGNWKESNFEISPGKWTRFLEFLKSSCRKWKKNYSSDICDGHQWEFEIVSPGVKIKSFGSNEYPDNFDNFMKEMQKLTGMNL